MLPNNRDAFFPSIAYPSVMIPSLDALFAPLAASTFFAEYYEKRHIHLRADHDDRRELLSHEELLQALVEAPAALEGLVCFPEQIGTTCAKLLSNVASLQEYLDAGHPLVWNRARGISARIDAVSALLAQAFGGHVWPNVYATGVAGTPFDMHFDAHEFVAIHCAGEKVWDISQVRVDRPIEAVEMETAIHHGLRTRRDEAMANITDTFTVHPGDLIYVPRGQFHNARTLEGRSLHVTFGIELPTGFDLAKRMVMAILADPAMREYPLPRVMDPDGEQSQAWCKAIASRMTRSFSPGAMATIRDEVERAWVTKSRGM
jgi:hypothetical protein